MLTCFIGFVKGSHINTSELIEHFGYILFISKYIGHSEFSKRLHRQVIIAIEENGGVIDGVGCLEALDACEGP